MQILLRKCDTKYYVWKEAEWRNGEYRVDGKIMPQVNILAIKNDNRGKYVKCAHCGAIMVDDPEVIEQHFATKEAERNCFECGSVRYYERSDQTTKRTKNADGTYHIEQSFNADVRCGYSWNSVSIDSPKVQNYCHYFRCRAMGVRPIDDVLMQYPGLFDKQITVDFLNKKGFAYERFNNRDFVYDLKLRGTLKACVNELGIVDHFYIKYRYDSYDVYYSAKYDMLVYRYGNNYTTNIPSYVSESKHNAVKAKLSALYKEASK